MTTAAVQIELESRPIERIACDLVVAGAFEADRPLRGAAARMDWRLCGLLSSLILDGRFTGGRGDVVLVPGDGALRSPRALLVGLGARARFPLAAAQDAMRDAMSRAMALGVRRVTVAPLGVASDDLPRHAAAVVGGVLEAARQGGGPVELVLALAGSQHDSATTALDRAIRAVAPEPISLRADDRSRPARSPRGAAAHPL